MASLIGKEIGKYRVTERIGRGGMAEVYEGVHTHLQRKVAIKVLHSHLLEGGDFVARFKREARAVANLQHPNIVQVHDFDIQDDLILMVMQYIDGENLHTKLVEMGKRGQRLPVKQIASIISDIAGALDYAHGKSMLHRDIKPSNIMVDQEGKAYLTDFGIAKLLDDPKFTATGQLIGTPAYMSPEQGKGEDLTEESDIYSLGVVAFELLTGQVPYDATTPIGVVHKQINDPIPSLNELVDGVPGTAQEVIDKALSKTPENRYTSAASLVNALRAALESLETPVSIPIKMPEEEAPTVVDDSLDAPTVTMESEVLEKPTVVMEENKPTERKRTKPESEGKSPRVKRRIPVWAYIAGGVALPVLVFAVLSQVLGFTISDMTKNLSQEKGSEAIVTQIDETDATPSTIDLISQITWVCDSDQYQECIDLNYALLDAGVVTAEGYHKIAESFINLGDRESAFEPLDQAIELDPGFTPAFYTRGSIKEELGDYEGALEDLFNSIVPGEETAGVYDRIGWSYTQLGEYEAALDAYARAIEIDPEYSWAYHNRGVLKQENGDLDGALEDYMKSIEIYPELSNSFHQIGIIYFEREQFDEALPYIEHALELDPESPWTRLWRAKIRWDAFSDMEGALEDLDLVINSHSEIIPWAYHMRANIYEQNNQYELCVSNFDEVVAVYPDDPWTYSLRGVCYERLGDYPAARADYQRFLDLTAGDPEYDENRYWIQKSLDNLNK